MLSGDNGVLQRATDAKEKTERATIIETAKTDILGQIAENKGTNITKGQLAEILNTYFKPTDTTAIPDEVSDESGHDIKLTTIDDKYNINLSQIYTGSFEVEHAKWTYNHNTQTVTNGTLTLNIGDYVNDTENTITGFDGKWRVLGEENGQLILVTSAFRVPFEGCDIYYPLLELSGADIWNNNGKKIDDIAKLYSNNEKLEKGRGITIEDINKITGYNPKNTGVNDPEQSGSGQMFDEGELDKYQNELTYKIIGGKVNYSIDKNEPKTYTPSQYFTVFKPLGNDESITGETSYIAESTVYVYYATTLSRTNDNSSEIGLSADSPAYNMLFKNVGAPYWTTSRYIGINEGQVYWGLRTVGEGCVQGAGIVWTSDQGISSSSLGVRPVCLLKSTVTPKFVSKDDTTNISTYEI